MMLAAFRAPESGGFPVLSLYVHQVGSKLSRECGLQEMTKGGFSAFQALLSRPKGNASVLGTFTAGHLIDIMLKEQGLQVR